jgi:putative glutamine amidotransferase
MRSDLPVLGICRGMQVMAVLPAERSSSTCPIVVGTDEHCPAPGVYAAPLRHSRQRNPSGRASSVTGRSTCRPTTTRPCGPPHSRPHGYRAAAWHDDGTLEAMEDPGSRFRIAVQWHPEAGADARLFRALVASVP